MDEKEPNQKLKPLNCDPDARRWTEEWYQVLREKPGAWNDEGWMLSWFANAIMCGMDVQRWNMESALRSERDNRKGCCPEMTSHHAALESEREKKDWEITALQRRTEEAEKAAVGHVGNRWATWKAHFEICQAELQAANENLRLLTEKLEVAREGLKRIASDKEFSHTISNADEKFVRKVWYVEFAKETLEKLKP